MLRENQERSSWGSGGWRRSGGGQQCITHPRIVWGLGDLVALWGIFGDLGQRLSIEVQRKGAWLPGEVDRGDWWLQKWGQQGKCTGLFADFLGREGGKVLRSELLWPALPYPGPADSHVLFSRALNCLLNSIYCLKLACIVKKTLLWPFRIITTRRQESDKSSVIL